MKHFLLGVLIAVLFAVAVSYAQGRYFVVGSDFDTRTIFDCADADFVNGRVEKIGKTQFKVLIQFNCKEVKI